MRWLARGEHELDSHGEREFGWLGERVAARALERSGLRLLGSRVAVDGVEVDLVLLDGSTLVCAEVKSSRVRLASIENVRWRPFDRVDAQRLRRQLRAAEILSGRLRVARARVDVVEVLWLCPTRRLHVFHHRAAASTR